MTHTTSTPRTVTTAERRSRLAHRHLLLPETRTDDVVAISDALLALHSSDPATVHLSAWARMAHPSLATTDHVLYQDRSLIRHHVMRRTLWVASRPVMGLMNATSGRRVAAGEHRKTLKMLAHTGMSDVDTWYDQATEQILGLFGSAEHLSTREIGKALPELSFTVETTPGNPKTAVVSAHSRLVVDLGFAGRLIRTHPGGAWNNSAYLWSATATWLGHDLPELDVDDSAASLVDRWLHQFGPGTTTDLQWWFGWTRTQTRAALAAAEAVPVDLEASPEPGWLAADDPGVDETPPWVAVLPSLDATTMGWKQRDWYLPSGAGEAFDRFGNAGATIWVDGRVVGAWTQDKAGELHHLWFEEVPVARRRQVEQRLDEVRGWLGDTVVTERFPGLSRATMLAQ